MKRLVLCVFLLASCGTRTEAGTSPAATTAASSSAATSASANAAPRRVPGSLVRVSVNGAEQPSTAPIPLPGGAPAVVTLLFPFDVERAAVERFLPRDVAASWTDDRTVALTIPESATAFKMAQIPSRDGSSVIDFVVVDVMFPPSRVVNVYRVADLTTVAAGGVLGPPVTPVASSSARVHLGSTRPLGGATLSPDARSILELDTAPGLAGRGVRIIDVATDVAYVLASPPASDGPFVFGDWLADGRLVLVGKKVWLGAADGNAMRVVADATAPDGWPESAALSPDGTRLALSWRGRVMTLELASGVFARVPESLRPCDPSPTIALAWSLDARRLAGTDCPAGATIETARVKIVDLPSARVVATIEGGAYSVSTFPSGELLIVRPSDVHGEGAPWLGVVMTFDGVEKQRYLGGAWQLSPDTRYLLQMEPTGGAGRDDGTFYTLIDQQTAARYGRLFLPWALRWLPDGRLAGF